MTDFPQKRKRTERELNISTSTVFAATRGRKMIQCNTWSEWFHDLCQIALCGKIWIMYGFCNECSQR